MHVKYDGVDKKKRPPGGERGNWPAVVLPAWKKFHTVHVVYFLVLFFSGGRHEIERKF